MFYFDADTTPDIKRLVIGNVYELIQGAGQEGESDFDTSSWKLVDMRYAKDTRATMSSGNDTYRLTLKYNRLQVVVEEEVAAEADEVQVLQTDEQQKEPYIEYVEEPEGMYLKPPKSPCMSPCIGDLGCSRLWILGR